MDKQEPQFSEDFFKQFKNKEEFDTFFNSLFKQGGEEMLKAELDEHLGYEKHSPESCNSGNSGQKAVYLAIMNIEKNGACRSITGGWCSINI